MRDPYHVAVTLKVGVEHRHKRPNFVVVSHVDGQKPRIKWLAPIRKPRAPKCKCGKPCAYYGPIGGYSAACERCNAKNAKRQRDARAEGRSGYSRKSAR